MFAEELKQYVEHSLSVKDVSGNYDALFVPGNMFLHTQLFFFTMFDLLNFPSWRRLSANR